MLHLVLCVALGLPKEPHAVHSLQQDAYPPLPALGASATVYVSGLSSGADMAANYMMAHSATTAGAAIFAGNMPRCYITYMPNDPLRACTDSPAGHSNPGCHEDPDMAPCDPEVRACPPGFGTEVMKCQGTCRAVELNRNNAFPNLR